MAEEEPRIGVFICQCGVNIGGVVKVPEVTKYARTLQNVAYAEDNIYTCSEAGLASIKKAINEHKLNRVIVASCTPRTHEPLFRSACEEAGLNKYLFEMANIREHCSWVHKHQPEKATKKAKDIVRMAVARAAWLSSQDEPELEIKDSSLVIGGGIAGMIAALTLAEQGFKVYLVEKEPELGGNLRRLHKLYPTMQDTSEILEPIIKAVNEHKNIETLTSTTVTDAKGYVGSFKTALAKNGGDKREIDVGTIIVTCGASSYTPPKGLYQYGTHPNIVTQLEMDELLGSGKIEKPPERVVMIQCVGARKGEIRAMDLAGFPKSDTARLLAKILKAKKEEGWPYCSKICCMNAIKNAILIKERFPETDVIILYGDVRVYKEYEDFYSMAREHQVKFVKHIEEVTPEIKQESDGRLTVSAYDALSGQEIHLPCDWIVLSTPLIPRKEEVILARLLKIPISQDGFLMEAHLKLRPVDTQTDGIFLAGTASGPKDVPESVVSAKAAAARAGTLMANKKMRTEALTSVVDEEQCIGCGLCEEICTYSAHYLEEGKSHTIAALCRGCGACAAECPRRAITMQHYTDDQVLAQVKAALTEEA
ncbi:MAG TPA: CoB--CoM heterodisulfide reductase iron-sulfur subunit A family protein [Candidatus Bathyarchaeia archaeon]|nr:CoB--CoM heterodisulfide reductase iron-sulfur subunit A family protein [Candidatus Bathyarchaeia archaeon]